MVFVLMYCLYCVKTVFLLMHCFPTFRSLIEVQICFFLDQLAFLTPFGFFAESHFNRDKESTFSFWFCCNQLVLISEVHLAIVLPFFYWPTFLHSFLQSGSIGLNGGNAFRIMHDIFLCCDQDTFLN